MQNSNLTLAQIANIIQVTPQTLKSMLNAVDDTILNWHTAPNQWCINEIIGHLIEADRHAFAGRISLILDQEQPEIPGWDPVVAAAERRDCNRDTVELIAQLERQRNEYAAFVRQLSVEQLNQTATYRHFGPFKAADFVYEWAYHDHSHLIQISDIIRLYVWPNFSDSMRTALSK